jgi:hypothetical protein
LPRVVLGRALHGIDTFSSGFSGPNPHHNQLSQRIIILASRNCKALNFDENWAKVHLAVFFWQSRKLMGIYML